jgi:flagellar hook-length control protein FliK
VGLESIVSTPVTPPPPKAAAPAAASASNSPGSTGSSSHSSSSQQSSAGSKGGPSGSAHNSSTSNAASRSAPTSSGKANTSASNRSATSSTPGKNAAAGSQANQNTSSSQTQSTAVGSASNAKNGATQPGTATGPSFIEALAQSQASAADSASAATTVTADASPEDVTGGKAKGTKDEDTDPTAASFGFLSQSLVVAMAGGQQPSAAGPATSTSDSTDGVSLASGSTIQSVVANLTKGTADELQDATTAAGDAKTAGSATGANAADGSSAGTSAFQAQMGVSSHFQANATANTQTTNDKVNSPVGSAAFNDEVGTKVTWMANQGQGLQSASLQVTPEHMGPVEVRISMQNGATSVAFSANHADTRAALEQALPRLREMFATQGLTLSDASVSQQSPRGQAQKQAVAAIGAIGGASTEDDSTSSITTVSSARLGLVDTYA